jgi:hypothetical protein
MCDHISRTQAPGLEEAVFGLSGAVVVEHEVGCAVVVDQSRDASQLAGTEAVYAGVNQQQLSMALKIPAGLIGSASGPSTLSTSCLAPSFLRGHLSSSSPSSSGAGTSSLYSNVTA